MSGTDPIRSGFVASWLQQALNLRMAPGVTDVVLNPDAHSGYGAPIGCDMVSQTNIYPGPVGVDIKCSMSLLQLDLPEEHILDRAVRRALINAIVERTPTGAGQGQRSAKKSRAVSRSLGFEAVTEGASEAVCRALGIPPEWALRCEDAAHVGHDETTGALAERMEWNLAHDLMRNFDDKRPQLGSYGGGNTSGEFVRGCRAADT